MASSSTSSSLFGFRPRLVPTLIAVPGIVLMLALSVWQVQRLQEKNDLNAFRLARATAAAVELPAGDVDLAEFEFRRVLVRGRFLHDKEIVMNGRSQRGNAGYEIITPLVREAGLPVMVSRGWIPYERRDPSTRAAGQVEGPVVVEGILRSDIRRGASWLMPDNEPERNQWFWFDLPRMGRTAGLGAVAPFYIEAIAAPNPGGYPVGGQTQIELQSSHLEYAITWFCLAIALAVIYVVWHRQRR